MSKRFVLSAIIICLCTMNIFASILPETNESYFNLFRIAYRDEELGAFWKFIIMAPTGILVILTTLHILEPKSIQVKRIHLALASYIGVIVYLICFGFIYTFFFLLNAGVDWLMKVTIEPDVEATATPIWKAGWTNILYPILFLSYAIVHRTMKYSTIEGGTKPSAPPKSETPSPLPRLYDDDDLL